MESILTCLKPPAACASSAIPILSINKALEMGVLEVPLVLLKFSEKTTPLFMDFSFLYIFRFCLRFFQADIFFQFQYHEKTSYTYHKWTMQQSRRQSKPPSPPLFFHECSPWNLF